MTLNQREGIVTASAIACLVVPPAFAFTAPEWLASYPGRAVLGLFFLPTFILSHRNLWRGAAAGLVAALVSLLATSLLAGPALRGTALPLAGLLVLVGSAAILSAALLHHSRLEAEERALSDPGTGLPNRRHGLLHLERAFAAARRGTELVVVLFDLDHFKLVNDRHGHAAGDEVLRQFARVLRTRTREMNLSARMGGEEFASVLEGTDIDGAVRFAEGVRADLAEIRFPFGEVTVSAGIAPYEAGMASPDVLIAAADQALYRAKASGRDRVEVVGPEGGGGTGVVPLTRADLDEGEDRPGSGQLVLVVDDDDDARRSIAKALRRTGYDVLETGEPARAMRIVQGLERPLDLVITDVLMPAMSGFRMTEHLIEEVGALRVLYISGYMGEEVEWSGAPGAVTAFLQKPVTLDDLRRTMKAILAREVPGEWRDAGAGGPDPAGTGDPDPAGTGEPETGRTRPPRPNHSDPASRLLAPSTILATSTSADGLKALTVRLRHLGYDDLIEVPLEDTGSGDVGRSFGLVVAWFDEAAEEAMDQVEALRRRAGGESRPPLLLLAEGLSAETSILWPQLYPALYLPTVTGLGELGLHVEHLLTSHELAIDHRSTRSEMEARIEAGVAELRAAYGDLVMRLARTSEIKDDATGRHSERVGETARKLALEMGLTVERADVIGQAAALHDIGKIAIPDAILNKPGDLTPTERELVRRHTVIGADLLTGSRHPVLQEAERIARAHHERWDGSGYPDGLAGEAIPLSARIVAVADVLDVVTHARSYVEASSNERAISVMVEGRGTFFDPGVVEALESLDRRDGLPPDPDRVPVAPRDASPRSPLEIQALLEDLDWT